MTLFSQKMVWPRERLQCISDGDARTQLRRSFQFLLKKVHDENSAYVSWSGEALQQISVLLQTCFNLFMHYHYHHHHRYYYHYYYYCIIKHCLGTALDMGKQHKETKVYFSPHCVPTILLCYIHTSDKKKHPGDCCDLCVGSVTP